MNQLPSVLYYNSLFEKYSSVSGLRVSLHYKITLVKSHLATIEMKTAPGFCCLHPLTSCVLVALLLVATVIQPSAFVPSLCNQCDKYTKKSPGILFPVDHGFIAVGEEG